MNTKRKNKGLITGIALVFLVSGYCLHAQTLQSFDKKGKYGFKDINDVVVIAPQYKYVKEFSQGLAAVRLKDKWGFIDTSGKEVIPSVYFEVESFSEGLAVAKREVLERFGYINTKGEEVLPFNFPSVGSFHNGFARSGALVGLTSKFGFIDKTGKTVVEPQYDYISYKNNIWEVKQGEKKGLLDSALKLILPVEYDAINDFYGGLAAVNIGGKLNSYYSVEGGKWGFVDNKGTLVVPLIYDGVVNGFNSEGLAKVKLNGEEFFINKSGEKVK
jgi:hypothetical protein